MSIHPVREIDHIVEALREPIRRFAARIQELAPGNALGWTIYAAAANGSVERQRPAIPSVLMLRTTDLDLLRHLGAIGQHYGRLGLAPPLIMTPPFLHALQETFPLELLEIQQAHSIVFGPDYFADLNLEDRNVRLQCERELDVMLIGLQQGLLATAGIEDRLAMLQREWLDGLLRALRGMLWLKGHKGRLSADQVVAEVSQVVKLPLEGIRRVVAAVASPSWDTIRQLHAEVEALGTAIDGW